MKHYDLIIIGGGAGAFATAIKAEELGAKTAMIADTHDLPLGGTCVNVGCVPSKALLYAGEMLHLAKGRSFPGIELEIKKFDFQRVIEDELNLVHTLRVEKYEKVLKHLKHIDLIEGRAKFISPTEVEINGQVLSAEKIIIATGSKATVAPIDGIHEAGYLTHIEILRLKEQPKELIVIGAGPVGLEFAQMFARFGTKVTVLHRSSSIFRSSERDLTDRLTQVLQKEGIRIETNVEVKKARIENGKKIVSYLINGVEENVSADAIMLATGKTPNTAGLGLEKAGVEINSSLAVTVNSAYQTTQPHIYAVGDVANLPLRLEITAGKEGTLAAENAITGSQKTIDYNTVPYTIFTDPQLAGVGYTEDAQMKAMGVCACRTVSFEAVPKAIIMHRTEGLIKMAIHPQTKQILGVHILAPHASELIAEAMMLIKNKNTIDDVVNSLPMFPTLSESLKVAALSFTKDISNLSCCI